MVQIPEPLIPPSGARVMSLTDGLSKVFNVSRCRVYFYMKREVINYDINV